jgi:hypothetical protein
MTAAGPLGLFTGIGVSAWAALAAGTVLVGKCATRAAGLVRAAA